MRTEEGRMGKGKEKMDDRSVRAGLGAGRIVELEKAEVVGSRKVRLEWKVRAENEFASEMVQIH
jgi:hypothetical protein